MQISELHKLLEECEGVVARLAADVRPTIDVTDYHELSFIILEVLGWTNTAYTDNPFGVNAVILSKFVKLRGSMKIHTARAVASRVRTYLKSQDRKVGAAKARASTDQAPRVRPVTARAVTFTATKWVAVPQTTDVQEKISALGAMLSSIIEQVSRSNLPANQQAITAIERQQLVAILETALNMLRSPLAEKSLIKKAGEILERGAQGAAEKGVQTGLGKLMALAFERLTELAKGIFS